MPKYCVRYYKTETSLVRYDMTVEAADEAAARARVQDYWENDGELTDEELNTEQSDKEFPDGTQFAYLADEHEPFAVCEVV